MPLRDHFRPPLRRGHQWQGLLAMWPTMLTVWLSRTLSDEFVAYPLLQTGPRFELFVTDIGPVDRPPTLTAPDEAAYAYQYEVLVDHPRGGRSEAAAVELVGPRNKDRPAARRAFAVNAAARLRRGASLAIVDIVTEPAWNLCPDVLKLLGITDPPPGLDPSAPAAISIRRRDTAEGAQLDIWAYPLEVGKPLPHLPVWLSDTVCVPLDLEQTYEDACRALRIP